MNIKKVLYNFFIKKTFYKNYFNTRFSKKVLLVYVSEAFQTKKGSAKFRSHTNRWRNLAIAEILHEKGYDVDILDYRDTKISRKITTKYELLLGMGETFDYLCINKPFLFDRKVYIGTGTYWEFQNEKEVERITEINKRYNASLKANRLAYNNPDMWNKINAIALLGSQFVEDTYRVAFKGPIFRFFNHGYDDYDFFDNEKDWSKVKKRFVYISGLGFALNGLDLIIEAFSKHPDWQLDIYGPLDGEGEFLNALNELIMKSPNIKLRGWIDVCGEEYKKLVNGHGAVVNALAINACETHGTVIVAMNHGLIPIVTQGGNTPLQELGFIIKSNNSIGVEDAVISYLKMDEVQLKKKAREVYNYARQNFSQKSFVKRFSEIIDEIKAL